MVGTDNIVSVQSGKTAECFPFEDGTISWIFFFFGNLILISSCFVMWINTNLYFIMRYYNRWNPSTSPRSKLNAYWLNYIKYQQNYQLWNLLQEK